MKTTTMIQVVAVDSFVTGSCQTLPATTVSGVKRSRSGENLAALSLPHRGSCSTNGHSSGPSLTPKEDENSWSTDSDTDESLSSYDGSATSEDEDSDTEDCDNQDQDPTAELRFLSHRDKILQSSYERLLVWMRSARYGEPPYDNLPPRKRARTDKWQKCSDCHQEEDEEDKELVVLSNVSGYFHLACPFYVANPDKHQQCLLQDDLQSIEDVIDHLQKRHTEPPYCPICREEFSENMERDNHIRARGCKFRKAKNIQGINEYQKKKLEKQDQVSLGESQRWLRIWATVFPDAKPRSWLYLSSGLGLKVSVARDFWNQNGLDCITQVLRGYGLHEDWVENEKQQTSLHQVIIHDLLKKVFEDDGCTWDSRFEDIWSYNKKVGKTPRMLVKD